MEEIIQYIVKQQNDIKFLIDFSHSICYLYDIIISRRATLVSIPLGHRRNGQQAFIF